MIHIENNGNKNNMEIIIKIIIIWKMKNNNKVHIFIKAVLVFVFWWPHQYLSALCSNALCDFQVRMGNLNFSLGRVQYDSPGPSPRFLWKPGWESGSGPPSWLWLCSSLCSYTGKHLHRCFTINTFTMLSSTAVCKPENVIFTHEAAIFSYTCISPLINTVILYFFCQVVRCALSLLFFYFTPKFIGKITL